jgi:hypothetical protein
MKYINIIFKILHTAAHTNKLQTSVFNIKKQNGPLLHTAEKEQEKS